MGASNSVAYLFSKRGVVVIEKSKTDEEKLTELALEHGADDVRDEGEAFVLDCDPTVYMDLRQALESAEIPVESGEVSMVAATNVAVAGDDAEKLLGLIEDLEDHDDVQNVYGNYELSEADLERLG